MASSWIVLSTKWSLQDVQAGLNVIITLFSALSVILFARLSWRSGVQRLHKQRRVPLSQLISLTTLGEVQDVVRMLKGRLLTSSYIGILLQCVVVIFFTATAILAGPVSRYSTRRGQIPKKSPVGGLLATTSDSCLWYATAQIDDLMTTLDRASFPTNQLLDYFPDNDRDWIYVPSEWNSTFSVDCNYTDLTPIHLISTGNYNYSNGGQTEILYELPGLWDIFSPEYKDNWFSVDWNLNGVTNDTQMIWTESVLFIVMTIQPDGQANLTTSMRLAIAAVHLKDAPEGNFTDNSSTGSFAPGAIPKSAYKKVECEIRPTAAGASLIAQETDNEEYYWRAFPDSFETNSPSCISVQLTSNYLNSVLKPTSFPTDGWEVVLPSGEEMFRFYQAYLLVKDTFYPHETTRTISVLHPTVEISAIFVTVMSLLILLVCLGATQYVYFLYRSPSRPKTVPQTKLDWMVQAMQEADGLWNDPNGSSSEMSTRLESDVHPRLNPTTRLQKATYSAVTGDAAFSASSKMFGTVDGLGHHASAIEVRQESASSENSQFKLGLLPFEARL